ncbi:hypothetical protein BKA66DRAFT_476476 [Pyrenochaeta sp. MPI-SDFR-AT-0127]|nr:hypothetical protein BKA66DRAFT_476476 [Pyrenochaeta sp. MPI-SDFR-AT-0127]
MLLFVFAARSVVVFRESVRAALQIQIATMSKNAASVGANQRNARNGLVDEWTLQRFMSHLEPFVWNCGARG